MTQQVTELKPAGSVGGKRAAEAPSATPPAAVPNGLKPGEAMSRALAAMAEANRYGRAGTKVAAKNAGRRVGAAGKKAGKRIGDKANHAGQRMAGAYGALRGAEPPYTWRTREVAALVLTAMAIGAALAGGYARRYRSMSLGE